MERQIREGEVARAAAEASLAATYHTMPGNVVSYDATQETATIQPAVNDVRQDLDSGARVSEPWDPIMGVPVSWPRFGGFVIKGTLNKYDPVVLLAFDLDPSAWRAGKPSTQPGDPPDATRHAGRYWLALPTSLYLKRGPTSAPGSGSLTIGAEGQDPLIIVTGSNIVLGSGAADAVSLASKSNASLSAIKTLIEALSTYALAIQAIVDPTNTITPALTGACTTAEAGIVDVASALIKAK